MKRTFVFGLIATTILAACGVRGMQTSDSEPWRTKGQTGQDEFRGGAHLFKALDLTPDQKVKIGAIMLAQRTTGNMSGRESMKELRTVLLAPTVDGATLTGMIQSQQAKSSEHLDRWVSVLGRIRDVLTPTQRDKAASLHQGA
ncbi:MAG: Spy/CpxP family protein refolding chaperone, partial [Candidatus Sericytochromatia bacterium]|nr:Spy/CpxP family protein refolding chaperone [Candidatus Sericytochromatia bacterium]